jgi:hypothetical protein
MTTARKTNPSQADSSSLEDRPEIAAGLAVAINLLNRSLLDIR